jgi:hypothetical protein
MQSLEMANAFGILKRAFDADALSRTGVSILLISALTIAIRYAW